MTQFLVWLFTPWLVSSAFRTPTKFSIWLPLGSRPSSLSSHSVTDGCQPVQRLSAVLLLQRSPLPRRWHSALVCKRISFSTPPAMIFIPKNCFSISFAKGVCALPGLSDKDLGKDDVRFGKVMSFATLSTGAVIEASTAPLSWPAEMNTSCAPAARKLASRARAKRAMLQFESEARLQNRLR